MKKLGVLLAASLISIGALASCGDNKKIEAKNVKGGSAEDREAIQNAVNGAIITTGGGTTILPTSTMEISDNDIGTSYVLLSTSQRKVKMEWNVEATGCTYQLIDIDEYHKFVDIAFPKKGEADGSLTFSLAKISCNDAVSTDPQIKYTCPVKAQTYRRSDYKIADLNKVVAKAIEVKNKKGEVIATADAGYDIVDYTLLNPYFITNNADAAEKQYLYVNTPGKIIYNTPDGNWGLIADGDQVMEYYAGGAYNLNEKTFPAMMDGNKYVSISGNMGMYLGNIQLGFITDMKKIDASLVTEPTMNFQEIDETALNAIKNEFGGHKQCVVGANLSNALYEVKGTYVPGSCKVNDKASTSVAVGTRFTIQVKLAGSEEVVTIAYDYHVCKEATDKTMFNTLKALVQANEASVVDIKGTLRYVATESQPFYQTAAVPGQWTLVPFDATHVVVGD